MAYIYIIKNDLNNKVYIGKTNFSITKRWIEHLKDSKRRRNEKRPLYNAINKYGENHFWIEQLEECSVEKSNEREIYWIDVFDSFKNGYNATRGGDGKTYLNYKKILSLYDTTRMTAPEIAKECNCHVDSVHNIINEYRDNVDFAERAQERVKQAGTSVKCVELNKNFRTLREAVLYMKKIGKCKAAEETGPAQHINDVCKGKRKTSYGYHWCYV